MRRNKDHQETYETDQVEVIEILRLVEEKDISEGDKEQRCAQAIEKAVKYNEKQKKRKRTVDTRSNPRN